MKIKTIGTGSLSVKQKPACTLIDDKILIDCGNGIVKSLLEQDVNISQINTVLITHLHGDHILDLPFLIMQRGFESSKNELNIFCPTGTINAIANIIKIAYSDIDDWTILRDKTKTKFIEFEHLKDQEITPGYLANSYSVKHGNLTPAYGFVIKCNDKSIGFTGDSTYCEAIDTIINNSNATIIDASFVDGNTKHMGVHDIELLAQKFSKTLITTHMSAAAREQLEQKHFTNVIVPDDGQIINI